MFERFFNKIFNIKFEPKQHKYYVNGKEIPSVTTIINKVLGNPFAQETLYMRQARDKGTLIHNAISKFILEGKEPDFPMAEFNNFIKLSNEHNISWTHSEEVVYGKIDDMEFAGTLDLFAFDKHEISDIKTGSTKALKKWQLQLSFYAQCLEFLLGIEVKKASILWLHNEDCEYIPITLLTVDELREFLKKYYQPELNITENVSLKCLSDKAIKEFNDTLTAIENMEQKIKSIKEQILSEMEQRQINQIKVGNRTISYVPSAQRESIDSKKLKAEYPQVWDMCKKVSKVNSSIRIK